MHTKDILAEALRNASLPDLAERASKGEFHDFLSPHPLPQLHLLEELERARRANPGLITAISRIQNRVMEGEFDASIEESEEWAESPEGRMTLRGLMTRTH